MALLTRPSSDEIQKRALQAAAKVALTLSAASVFGACGGSMSSETTHVASDDAATDTLAADVATVTVDSATDTVRPVPDSVIEATACGPIAPDAATTDQTACCAARVRDAFSPTWTESDETVSGIHPELAECCGVIVDRYNGTDELGLTFQQARACCYVLPPPWYSHGGTACTPWGPPMPPEMPGAIRDAEVVS